LASRHASATYRELVEFLALPNVATVGADIQKNVAWLDQAFRKRGFKTQELANGDKPMLFAEFPGTSPDRKTVLLYAHLDGQAVTPAEWKQESPWKATLKRRNARGEWEALPLERLFGPEIDPDWRLFARSSSDDKGPIMMLLAAFDALKAEGLVPAVNVKVLLDSQEEQGSPTLDKVIAENLTLLRSDALVVLDSPMHPSNRPTLVFGNRGIARATLTVFGPKSELHSGHYGNYAPNPAQGLAELLASMKDESGRVTIPGYYDGVVLDDDTRRIMAATPDDEDELKRRLGIAETDRVGANLQEALQYPSLNIRGMASADIGDRARTIIPATATAEIDIRTVPEAPATRQFDLLKRHVEAQGYYLVAAEPTDEERQKHPRLASLTFLPGSASSAAVRTDLQAPVGQWVYRAFEETYGTEPVRIRMMGGTVPTGVAVEALKAPFVIAPLVNADNNQHSSNENIRLGNYVEGVKGIIGLLQEPF
jgi:acetylornithine deacetylase/succinyl-diaminopimelate desuccinylase-like protein